MCIYLDRSSVAQSWTEASRGDRISPEQVIVQRSEKCNDKSGQRIFRQRYVPAERVLRTADHWRTAPSVRMRRCLASRPAVSAPEQRQLAHFTFDHAEPLASRVSRLVAFPAHRHTISTAPDTSRMISTTRRKAVSSRRP